MARNSQGKTSPGQQLLNNVTGQSAPDPPETEPVQSPADEPVQQPELQAQAPQPDHTPSPAAPETFLDQVKSLGFENIASDEDARARLLESYRQQQERLSGIETRIREIEPLAKYGAEYLETLRGAPPSHHQPQQPQAQPQAQRGWWNPPQVDQQIVQKYRRSAPDGGVAWSPDTPAHVRVDAEKHQQYIEDWTNRLIYKPDEALEAPVAAILERKLTELFGGIPLTELPDRLDVNGERKQFDAFVAEHQDRLFVKNPVTSRLDYNALTPFGETVNRRLEQLHALPVADRLALAIELAEKDHPAVTLPAKRQEVRREVARRAGAGAVPQAASGEGRTRPNPNLSPGQELVARLEGTLT